MDERGPVAGRIRRPGWKDPRLLAGLLLIALSVVGVAAAMDASSTTAPYWVATDTLTPGTVLDESVVAVAEVRVDDGLYMGADGEVPWGQVVTRVVEPGELIPLAALAAPADFDGRPVAVVADAPLAAEIAPGSTVDVWLTASDEAGQAHSALVGENLVVADVDRQDGAFSTRSGETVYVVVAGADMGDFLVALAGDGDVSVVGRPGGA